MTTTRLTEAEIHRLAERAFLANGMGADQAGCIAQIVTRAERDECRSHGLYRVPGYVAAMRAGRANPSPTPRLTRSAPAILRCDGDRGFAPFAFAQAEAALIDAARSQGIAALAVQNSHHFSALWAEIETLTGAGLVAWAFVVGQCAVAPHGGTKRLFGTNPMAFGWPRPGHDPVIFDFATSAAARGEVELRRLAGEDLPEGWGIDAQGQPSTDPGAVLQGALLPFGGHKGSALSLMVELIAGPLIGEMTSRQIAATGIKDSGPPPGGELILALDPAAFGHDAMALGEKLLADFTGEPGLRLPSARRYSARARHQAKEIQVSSALLAEIEALCG